MSLSSFTLKCNGIYYIIFRMHSSHCDFLSARQELGLNNPNSKAKWADSNTRDEVAVAGYTLKAYSIAADMTASTMGIRMESIEGRGKDAATDNAGMEKKYHE